MVRIVCHIMVNMFDTTPEQIATVNRLMTKRDQHDGIALGYHGTSASRARSISASGFVDYLPAPGEWNNTPGEFFWDEEYQQNAIYPGQEKVRKDGEKEFAIINSRLVNPAPDYYLFRPEWRANAANVGIIAVQYYDVESRELLAEQTDFKAF